MARPVIRGLPESDNAQHFIDVLADIGDSYVPDPAERAEMLSDIREAIAVLLEALTEGGDRRQSATTDDPT